MKSIVAAVLMAASVAFAGNGNGPGDDTVTTGGSSATIGNVTATGLGGNGGNGGNATANGGSASANGGTHIQTNTQTTVNTNTAVSGSNSTSGAVAGAKASQAQGQVAKGGNAKQAQSANNEGITNVWSNQEAPNASASAAALVVQVASACGGTVGGSGQGFGGGGALGVSFEFVDCKVMREAAFLVALGATEAGVQHVARNIPRFAKTLEAMGYTVKYDKADPAVKPAVAAPKGFGRS